MRYAIAIVISFVCFSFESEGMFKRFGKFMEKAGQDTRDCARRVAPKVKKETERVLGQAEDLGRGIGNGAERFGQEVRDALRTPKSNEEHLAEISGLSEEAAEGAADVVQRGADEDAAASVFEPGNNSKVEKSSDEIQLEILQVRLQILETQKRIAEQRERAQTEVESSSETSGPLPKRSNTTSSQTSLEEAEVVEQSESNTDKATADKLPIWKPKKEDEEADNK